MGNNETLENRGNEMTKEQLLKLVADKFESRLRKLDIQTDQIDRAVGQLAMSIVEALAEQLPYTS